MTYGRRATDVLLASTRRADTGRTNPLRDRRDKRLNRVAGPCGLVMFGVTGDLSRKKVMPAIYDLANRGLLPPGFSLVGFARRDWVDQDFAQIVHDSVKAHARTEFREEVWNQLAEGFRFVPGSYDDPEAFAQLRRTTEELDEVRGTGGNHAFYLAATGIGGRAWEGAGLVWYDVLTSSGLPRDTDFAGFAAATVRAAAARFGEGGRQATAVADAWEQVGLPVDAAPATAR